MIASSTTLNFFHHFSNFLLLLLPSNWSSVTTENTSEAQPHEKSCHQSTSGAWTRDLRHTVYAPYPSGLDNRLLGNGRSCCSLLNTDTKTWVNSVNTNLGMKPGYETSKISWKWVLTFPRYFYTSHVRVRLYQTDNILEESDTPQKDIFPDIRFGM